MYFKTKSLVVLFATWSWMLSRKEWICESLNGTWCLVKHNNPMYNWGRWVSMIRCMSWPMDATTIACRDFPRCCFIARRLLNVKHEWTHSVLWGVVFTSTNASDSDGWNSPKVWRCSNKSIMTNTPRVGSTPEEKVVDAMFTIRTSGTVLGTIPRAKVELGG